MFEEYLDDVKRILRKKNQQYIKLQEKYNKILDENVANVVLLRTKTFGVCFYFRNIFFILQKEFVQMQQRMNKTII